jgi:hypothetical protein
VIALTPPAPGEDDTGRAKPGVGDDLVTDPAAMTAAQRDAHNAWAELLDTMIDYGVFVDPAETPRATVGRLAAGPDFAPTGRPSTAVLARAEERARYAPSPVRTTNLNDAIAQARAAFEEYATRQERIRAFLFPRSVLLTWRMAWYGFIARATRGIARLRDILLFVSLRNRRR